MEAYKLYWVTQAKIKPGKNKEAIKWWKEKAEPNILADPWTKSLRWYAVQFGLGGEYSIEIWQEVGSYAAFDEIDKFWEEGSDAAKKRIETGKEGIELVLHPSAFRFPRYLKMTEDSKAYFLKFTREIVEKTGVKVVETKEPYSLLDGNVLFLGEIERKTDFEKGFPSAHFDEDGVEKWDPIEDDTSIVMHVKGKGLVVLSGCAHSGIINTVNYAKAVTGIEDVFTIMGGFHLSGPAFEPIIGRTTEELKKFNLEYMIPVHCTGRKAIIHIEKEMPDQFILNMSGTKLTFMSD